MSRRTIEANKAVLAAWQNEQDLVRDGKGTRDWTQQQQQDILDKGKAYDDNGKAFEGQHMKSVEKYPEYQGDPKNIQFLTKAEHLEAHQGNWQNPTNWYYDPVTKQFFDFGEGCFVPCQIIPLSNPIVTIDTHNAVAPAESVEHSEVAPSSGTDPPSPSSNKPVHKAVKSVSAPKGEPKKVLKRFVYGAGQIARKVGKFALDHKEEIIGVAVTVGTAIWAAVTSSDGSSSENSDYNAADNRESSPPGSDNCDCADTPSSVERVSPREHEVPKHSQRYHTKNGIVVREKEPYHRGGKKEE